MSIEKKITENLVAALTDYIRAVKLDGQEPAAAAAPAKTKKKKAEAPAVSAEDKKQIAELKDQAKLAASKVLKDLGKEGLTELLERYGCKKFSDMLEEAEIFQRFISTAEKMIAEAEKAAEPAADDLLDDTPADPPASIKIYTLEDVKGLLLKINSAPDLGREITKQVLSELGVMRLGELPAEKYTEAYNRAEAVLKESGALE